MFLNIYRAISNFIRSRKFFCLCTHVMCVRCSTHMTYIYIYMYIHVCVHIHEASHVLHVLLYIYEPTYI